MTGRRFVVRAARISIVVFFVCMVALAIGMVVASWAEADSEAGQHPLIVTMLVALTLIVYAVAFPTMPITGWITGPDSLEVPTVLAMGSICWGSIIAAVWSLIDWLWRRRADRQAQESGAYGDSGSADT